MRRKTRSFSELRKRDKKRIASHNCYRNCVCSIVMLVLKVALVSCSLPVAEAPLSPFVAVRGETGASSSGGTASLFTFFPVALIDGVFSIPRVADARRCAQV